MKNSIQIKAADTLKAAHGYSASVVRLRNTSAVSIDYSVSGGSAVDLAAGASAVVDVAGLTSEIAVRRTDLSATPANVLLEFGLTADEAYEQSTLAAAASTAAHNTDPAAHATEIATAINTLAAPAGHLTDVTAHLNIVRRTLTDNLTLTTADYPQQKIVPDADRDVILPAEGTAQWQFKLCHAGASYNLTIKRAGGTVVGILIPGSTLVVAWDGTAIGLC